MNQTCIRSVTRRFTDPYSGTYATDADLLGRFLDGRDQSAFAALVARHGPAVRAVCRSILRDANDADDAVQATFLVLVRRAGAVRDRDALGGWLCRVAWRTANRLLDENRRRASRTAVGTDPDTTPAAEPPGHSGDVAAVLDEIGRLPEVYRVAVLTCYATGTSTAEAARQLGWPKGTLLTRLAWARKRLRTRLDRRGVTLSGGLVAALGCQLGTAGARVFANRTARVVAAWAVGAPVAQDLVSERVLSLTNGVVRAMIGTKLKAALGVGLLAAVFLGLGLGRPTLGTAEAKPGEAKTVRTADKGATDGKGQTNANATPAGPVPPAKAQAPATELDRVRVTKVGAALAGPTVSKQLELTAEQVKALDAAWGEASAGLRTAIKLRNGTPDSVLDLFTSLDDTVQAFDERAVKVLTPVQLARLRQVQLQRDGPAALVSRHGVRVLKLTPEQEDGIAGEVSKMRTAMDARITFAQWNNNDPNLELFFKKQANEYEAGLEAVRKHLTADQRKTWDELVGAPLPALELVRARNAFSDSRFVRLISEENQ